MRTSGVLMPISSLPSPYGIGTMGKSARKFVDFLVKGGQTYWQILPICPTSYGDSPYQSFSSFAGNPYFIDLDILCKENLLKKKECESFDWGTSEEYIDYGTMYVSRYALLHKAYARFVKNMPEDFSSFCETEKDWLEDYTLFMALKDANDGKAWAEWDEKLRVRDAAALDEARKKYAEDIEFYKMLQYLFFKQWRELKAYANENGIEIIGDVPIYVAGDSADVWAVIVPEEYMGDVIGDLNSRRGEIQGFEERTGAKQINAHVPLSEMFGYATDLRSKTQGRGQYVMEPDGYKEVPKSIAEKIISERTKKD